MPTHRPRDPDRLTFTIEEVAVALGIDRSTAYGLAKANRLPAPVIRLGRRMVVGRAALHQALATGVDPALTSEEDDRDPRADPRLAHLASAADATST